METNHQPHRLPPTVFDPFGRQKSNLRSEIMIFSFVNDDDFFEVTNVSTVFLKRLFVVLSTMLPFLKQVLRYCIILVYYYEIKHFQDFSYIIVCLPIWVEVSTQNKTSPHFLKKSLHARVVCFHPIPVS